MAGKNLKTHRIEGIDPANTTDFLRRDGSWIAPPADTGTGSYTHPSGFGNAPATVLSGASVISQILVNTEGHVTGVNTRGLAAGDIGAEPAITKNTGFNLAVGTTAGTLAAGDDSRILNGNTAFGWGNHSLAGYLTSMALFTRSAAGAVPAPGGTTTTKYMREDGTWVVPPNTTYAVGTDAEFDSTTSTVGRLITGQRINSWATRKGFLTTANIIGTSRREGAVLTENAEDLDLFHTNSSAFYTTHASAPYSGGGNVLQLMSPAGNGAYGTQLYMGLNASMFIRSMYSTWGTWHKVRTSVDIPDADITNWNSAFGWGNHASAGYLTTAPVTSVNSKTGAVTLTATDIAALSTAGGTLTGDTVIAGSSSISVEGSMNNSSKLLLRGYYDSNGDAGGIAPAAADYSIQSILMKGSTYMTDLALRSSEGYGITVKSWGDIYVYKSTGTYTVYHSGNLTPGSDGTDHNHDGRYELAFNKNTGFNKNFGTAAGTVSEGNHTHSNYLLTTGTAADSAKINGYGGLTEGTNGSLRITSATGYLNAGPLNASYSHFDTDRPKFYFNKPADINGGLNDYATGGKYWHAGNDGAGSGLDADLLDGLGSSAFLRSNAANSNDLTFNSGNGRGIKFWNSSNYMIWMASATDTAWGGRHDTGSSYNMYFRMLNGTVGDRGFAWVNQSHNGTSETAHVIGHLTLNGMWAKDFKQTSDIRLKEDFMPIEDALETVKKIEAFSHTWKERKDNKRSLGVSAQQLLELVPEVVSEGERLHVSYTQLIPLLIKAMQEQQAQIEELKRVIA